ncbi:hypothetical protein DVR12_21695 [Chitinophaga silvatica]|uniref:Uncharacterized protein n=1 Tax=Chitinophaga silvatica TaxID=2282649 RepID=A0A3E1Y4W1_9BACT|nr:hypothetical protein [Chitinophaga silvatica]RFS19714.1 hypothetical protein DVR12_21695 [Chitinophaga silvatica]
MIIENDNKMLLDFWFEEFITGNTIRSLTRSKLEEIRDRIYHYERIESALEEERAFMDCLNSHKYFVQKMIFDFICLLVDEKLDIELGFCTRHVDVEVWIITIDDADEVVDQLIRLETQAAKKYYGLDCHFSSMYFEERDNIRFPKDFIIFGSNIQN